MKTATFVLALGLCSSILANTAELAKAQSAVEKGLLGAIALGIGYLLGRSTAEAHEKDKGTIYAIGSGWGVTARYCVTTDNRWCTPCNLSGNSCKSTGEQDIDLELANNR